MKETTIQKLYLELYSRLNKLQKLEYEKLNLLNGSPIKETIKIDNKTFTFTCWSEQAVGEKEGVIAVLVDTWTNNFISKTHHIKGYICDRNGFLKELEEAELWEYD